MPKNRRKITIYLTNWFTSVTFTKRFSYFFKFQNLIQFRMLQISYIRVSNHNAFTWLSILKELLPGILDFHLIETPLRIIGYTTRLSMQSSRVSCRLPYDTYSTSSGINEGKSWFCI